MAAPSSTAQVVALGGLAGAAVVAAVLPVLGDLAPFLAWRASSVVAFAVAAGCLWRRAAEDAAAPAGPGSTSPVAGWLFAACALVLGVMNVGLGPGSATAAQLVTGGYLLFTAPFAHLLVSYPTGRLRGRAEHAAVTATWVVVAVVLLAQLLVGDDAGRRACAWSSCPDAVGVWLRSSPAAAGVERFGSAAVLLVLGCAAAAVLRRWRGFSPGLRRQLRPAAAAVALGVALAGLALGAALLGATLTDAAGNVFSAAVAAVATVLPLALLWGVLRQRLLFQGMGQVLTPLTGAQDGAALSDVVARLLDTPGAEVVELVGEGPGPDGAGGSYRRADGSLLRWPPAATGSVLVPVGEPRIGAILFDARVAPPPRLVAAVAATVALVLRHHRWRAELAEQLEEVRASRTRLVTAADEERRRIERDLHDGAQQYLVGSALTVRLARERVHADPAAALVLLVQAEEHLRAALEGVRDLARGLCPPVLAEHGLVAAVESLAGRLPLVVDVRDDVRGRLEQPVELAAYFVVGEALVNVVKHAQVEAARVTLSRRDGDLVVDVRDRGRGGADPGAGAGLRGLADRVAALGGTVTVDSAAGAGTSVRAVLPGGAAAAREG